MIAYITHNGYNYWYEHKLPKEGDLCLVLSENQYQCNGYYVYPKKENNELAYVIITTDNPTLNKIKI